MTQKRFIEQFEENVRLYPEKIILQDKESRLTFRQLDELSGRVYAYLKQKGIGREDFVMICLPHGVMCVVALLGIIKCGAVSVPVAETLPEERKRFISKDCGMKMEVNSSNWQSIVSCESLNGFETTDAHSAFLAVYTSGSEGTPKGILHEYGNLDLFVKGFSVDGRRVYNSDDVAVLPFPLQSTLYVIGVTNALYDAVTFDIAPLELVANPNAFEHYLIERRATVTCLTSAFLNVHHTSSPYLRLVILTMEVVHGVDDCPYEFANLYGQSEGYTVCINFFRGKTGNIPIGKPTDACSGIVILDGETPVAAGQMGELCYENSYMRGYINDSEGTKSSFCNGIFRTGDIARINEDGNYVILGRKTDMIKINGNRIEPAEIEAAVKRVLNIDWAFAKGFVEEDRSYICVYYTADIEVDVERTRNELMQILPTYMMPSYFVHIDEIPHLPNGKIDRQAFKAPAVRDYVEDYIAPTNELESKLCVAMQEVLGIEKVGINDDFYLLGGDSLRTIRLVCKCDVPDLKAADIYAARTPAKIAEQWMMKQLE